MSTIANSRSDDRKEPCGGRLEPDQAYGMVLDASLPSCIFLKKDEARRPYTVTGRCCSEPTIYFVELQVLGAHGHVYGK